MEVLDGGGGVGHRYYTSVPRYGGILSMVWTSILLNSRKARIVKVGTIDCCQLHRLCVNQFSGRKLLALQSTSMCLKFPPSKESAKCFHCYLAVYLTPTTPCWKDSFMSQPTLLHSIYYLWYICKEFILIAAKKVRQAVRLLGLIVHQIRVVEERVCIQFLICSSV